VSLDSLEKEPVLLKKIEHQAAIETAAKTLHHESVFKL